MGDGHEDSAAKVLGYTFKTLLSTLALPESDLNHMPRTSVVGFVFVGVFLLLLFVVCLFGAFPPTIHIMPAYWEL